MAEEKYKFDYKEPENVESQVPGEQKLRGDPIPNAVAIPAESDGDTVENPDDYVLSPVVTITKNEATFTKGDMKLHKITVTENVSQNQNGATINDSEISGVTRDFQPIRAMEDNNEERQRTRIPKLKFRQAVNRVRREKSESDKREREIPNHKHIPRRSSIPKLKRHKSENKTETKEKTEPEDEFDKIYDEIVDSKVEIDENVLITKIDDPVKVETCFEEIIHAYDENKIEPIAIDHTIIKSNESETETMTIKHTKIPMLRRKSEQEVEVSKSVDSVNKTNTSGARIKVREAISKFSQVDKGDYKPRRLPVRTGIPKKIVNEGKTSVLEVDNTVCDVKKYKMHVENVEFKVSYENSVDLTNVSNEDPESIVEINYEVQTEVEEPEINVIETKEAVAQNVTEIIEQETPIINETIELLPKQETNSTETKQTENYVSKEFTNEGTINKIEDTSERLIKQTTIQEYTYESAIPINSVIEEYEIKTEETVEYDNVTNNSDDIENKTQTSVKETKIHNREINSHVNVLNKDNKKEDSDEDVPLIKGKVNRMINRLHSREPKDESKTIVENEIPKTKSVLSKIAMFERQEPLDVEPAIPKWKSFPKHSPKIEEIVCNKPKIVNGVLKPAPRNVNSNGINSKDDFANDLTRRNNDIVLTEIKTHVVHIEEVSSLHSAVEEFVITENQSVADNVYEKTTTENESYVYINKDAKDNFEIEIKSADTYKVEYVQPINQMDKVIEDYRSKAHKIRVQNENEGFIHHMNENTFDFEPKSIENKELHSLDSRIKMYKSNGEVGLKRVKSVAEMDLGDVVKGKVHQLVARMSSTENLEVEKREVINVEKKEVISVKERPRKKSVSEKIALFEGKLTSASTHTVPRTLKLATPKPEDQSLTEDEYQARIAELASAQVTYGRVTDMTYVVLGNGLEMPVIAVGTALLDKRLIPHIISAAIDLGYRAIDTAFIYGNEKEVGEGIKRKIEDGTVKREDLFIISKLWSTYHRTDLVEEACKRSLQALGLDYVDLFLIHNPMSFKEGADPLPKIANVLQYSDHDYLDAWYGMERLVAQGLVRSIGVSNFNSSQLQRVVEKARIKPVVNQVECHPYLSQQRLDEFCAERNVKLSCFGVLGSKGTPAELRGAATAVIDDPLVQVMAAGLNVTPAQLLIRYQIESGRAVVVKASTGAHLWDNLRSLAVTLSPAQVDALAALNRNKRTFTFKGMGDTHKNYPFKAPF